MKILSVTEKTSFNQLHMGRLLVHDSPHFKILSFSFLEGQELPVHSHEIEGEVSIFVIEGEGEFLGGEVPIPAKAGDIMICNISEPHGIRAKGPMRVLVTIAPPI